MTSIGEVALQTTRRWFAAVLAAGLVLGAGQAGWASPESRANSDGPLGRPVAARPAGPQAGSVTVTLLTGDRVTVTGTGAEHYAVRPGPGRQHIRFLTHRERDALYVIPQDAQRLVQTGKLDRRLFDVAGLVRYGYHDAARDSLPLIVSYQAGAARRAAAGTMGATGVRVIRELPAINGAAVVAEKDEAAAFWTSIAGAGQGARADAGGGFDKIWLDGKRQISLDSSVPQIGAPAAHQAGFTGRGVTVAVLDSGVDESASRPGRQGGRGAKLLRGAGGGRPRRSRHPRGLDHRRQRCRLRREVPGGRPGCHVALRQGLRGVRLYRVGDPGRDAVGRRRQAGAS